MPEHKARPIARRNETALVENPPGILRATMAYNDQVVVCHFTMKKGSVLPLHTHAVAQNGYVIRGRLRMSRGCGKEFVADAGTGYCFSPDEEHGAKVLEDSEVIECFAPLRPDYIVKKSAGPWASMNASPVLP